jgi:hypothetical protein
MYLVKCTEIIIRLYLLVCAAASDLPYLKQTIRIVCELITVKNHHCFWITRNQILYLFNLLKTYCSRDAPPV